VVEVEERLSSKFKCASIDIQPLLKALYQARMIRSIDGLAIEPDAPSFTRQCRQRMEWLQMRAGGAALRTLMGLLPVGVAYRVLDWIRPNWSRRQLSSVFTLAQQNLTSVFGASLGMKRIRSLAHAFVSEQIRRDIDLQFLSVLPELEVGKWLRRDCSFQGLEHLDSALAAGRGVLLSSFHFSSAHLIVLLLWLRGYSFTGAGGITRNNRNRLLPFDNPQLAEQLKGCGKVKWFTTLTMESALNICRLVNKGGIGLVFPDGFASRPKEDVSAYFGHDAAKYKRAVAAVPFLGRVAQGNTGVPWIYKQSSAPLIPIKLVRDSLHHFKVIVGPEITLDRTAPLERITAQLYEVLEREIALDPASWAYWRILDRLMVSSEPVPTGR